MLILIRLLLVKLYNSILASPFFATVALLFDPLRQLIADELSFFSILTMALIIDLIIGAIKYWKLSQFSFKKLLLGLMIKVIVSYGGMMLFLSFKSLDPGIAAEWFALVAKFTVLLYPAGSAFTNMYTVTDGKFPPLGFMKKLQTYGDSTDALSKLETKKDDGK